MNYYLSVITKLAKAKLVFSLFLAFACIYYLLNFTHLPFSIPAIMDASGGKTILNLLPYYSATQAYEYIAAYTDRAVSIYHAIILIDVVALIPVYVLFFSAAILHGGNLVLRGRGQSVLHTLAALPLFAAVLNLFEDGIIVYLLASYPERHETLASICGVLTTTKSVFILVSLLSVIAFYFLIGCSRAVFLCKLRECHL